MRARSLWVLFFALFLASGACSLVYQVVWMRLAVARFGVTTALVSIVLSVFMGGLALGSYAAGRLSRRQPELGAGAFLRLYACAELGIALSAEAVPLLLSAGRFVLNETAPLAWSSGLYHAAAGAWIAAALLPFCTLMGATLPLAMAALRRSHAEGWAGSFSHLYVANVCGAAAGTLLCAFVLIELLGFAGTARAAAAVNLLLAASALVASFGADTGATKAAAAGWSPAPLSDGRLLPALFATGFASMAMEVVWVRQFTPFLGTMVYAFASILAVYLLATLVGSAIYRRRAAGRDPRASPEILPAWLGAAVAVTSLLPLLAADPGLPLGARGLAVLVEKSPLLGAARVALGIVPFCALLGYLTPSLVDALSRGDPDRAGRGYAVNVVGCIAGPLAAGFWLIPWLGERVALAVLSVALLAMLALRPAPAFGLGSRPGRWPPWRPVAAALALGAALIATTRSFESIVPGGLVRRDSTATVVAAGEGLRKILLVNGQGMTRLTPITKMMAHLPLAFVSHPPRSGLAVCLGMGTSYRSIASWGVRTTAVELVPSVPELLGFFFPDGPALASSGGARIVVDDGRRFLERSRETYDAIVLDPPPPPEAAGSSLLYSTEFYEAASRRLAPGGVLQQWIPWGDPTVLASYLRAVQRVFPQVRVFRSIEGWGAHVLASRGPLPATDAEALARRLPPAARRDLLEWGPAATAEAQLRLVLEGEIPPQALADLDLGAEALSDDRPVNEYFLLRRLFRGAPAAPLPPPPE